MLDSDPLASFKVPLAKYKVRGKLRIVTLNNTPSWYRYKVSEIKNNYKKMLTEFFIPEPPREYTTIKIMISVLRHNKRKLDSDNVASWSLKWLIDTIQDTGWLSDDDQVEYCVKPSQYQPGLKETLLDIQIYER